MEETRRAVVYTQNFLEGLSTSPARSREFLNQQLQRLQEKLDLLSSKLVANEVDDGEKG